MLVINTEVRYTDPHCVFNNYDFAVGCHFRPHKNVQILTRWSMHLNHAPRFQGEYLGELHGSLVQLYFEVDQDIAYMLNFLLGCHQMCQIFNASGPQFPAKYRPVW